MMFGRLNMVFCLKLQVKMTKFGSNAFKHMGYIGPKQSNFMAKFACTNPYRQLQYLRECKLHLFVVAP